MTKDELIYLASPYSAGDREANFNLVSALAAELVSQGYNVISPITYGHTLLQFKDMPEDWGFWMNFCSKLLYKCDKMIVYQMPGWETSRGIQEEISIANDHNIPIEYIEYVEPTLQLDFKDRDDYPVYVMTQDWVSMSTDNKTPKWDL